MSETTYRARHQDYTMRDILQCELADLLERIQQTTDDHYLMGDIEHWWLLEEQERVGEMRFLLQDQIVGEITDQDELAIILESIEHGFNHYCGRHF